MDRRRSLLEAAGDLFGRRGYHAVSVGEIGAAVGITGPGIYRHFPSKLDILVELCESVSQQLLDGAREIVAQHHDPAARLRAQIARHATFASTEGGLIRLYLQEESNLPTPSRQRVRRIQRLYVEEWVSNLVELDGELSEAEVRTLVHAAIGLLNSVSYHNSGLPLDVTVTMLSDRAQACLGIPAGVERGVR